jgi:hypothetical protein
VMKGYRHRLLWTSCLQLVSHVRSQQGIADGQVSTTLLYYWMINMMYLYLFE